MIIAIDTGENTGMGLSKKLQAQSRLLLSIAIIVIVIVGVGIAFVALSVPTQQAAVDDVFVDDVYAEDSDAGGTIDIKTTLRDDRDIIIRRTDPDIWDMPFAIVDPTTSQEVGSYGIELDFNCWGKNIDWTSFLLTGTWKMSQYIGVDSYGNYLSDRSQTYTPFETIETRNPPFQARADGMDAVSGTMVFQAVNVADIMPDEVLGYDTSIEGAPRPVFHDQRTAFTHEMTFVFDATFSLVVDDDWGNTYDSTYDVHIALVLVWEGSEFGIEWNPEDTTTTEEPTATTATPPPPPADYTPPPKDVPIIDDFGDPIDDPISDERIFITNPATDDIIAASLTGGTGSLMVVVVVLAILLPVIAYWKIKK